MGFVPSIKRFLCCLFILAFVAVSFAPSASVAQDAENTVLPKLPDPIQNLANEGAQIRFLGKDYGLEGWIAIKNGQEQYFYVMPGTGVFLTGILFDTTGKAVTVEQVRRLRSQNGGEFLDVLTADTPSQAAIEASQEKKAEKYEFKTPSEQLYWDIENSNWVPTGQAGTPLFYAFIDPQCPHCHEMMKAMRPYVEAGKAQVRMIPVGFKEQSKAQAAYLLATPSPEEVWWKHLEGDASALPVHLDINQQGVERNMAVIQSWKLNVTPLIVYRGVDQKVKIIRGKPKDIDALIKDLGART